MGRLAIVFAVLVIGGVLALPAAAITDGQPDNDGHPYVGLMVAQDASGNPLWRCSGTLLSADGLPHRGTLHRGTRSEGEIWFAAGPIPTDPNYKSVASGRHGLRQRGGDGISLSRRYRWHRAYASELRSRRVLPLRPRRRRLSTTPSCRTTYGAAAQA